LRNDRMNTMRPTVRPIPSCARAAIGFALGVGLLALAAPVRAEDDNVPFDTQIVRSILGGLGLERGDQHQTINYQERPPLVLPRNDNLPPPGGTDPSVSDPAWPKDPDVTARKKEAAQQRNRVRFSDDDERESRALPPDQIDIGKTNPEAMARARQRAQPGGPGAGEVKERLSPSELGFKPDNLFQRIFGGKNNEAVRFTGEPPRTNLTEPPPGYQTPSADQPYGTGRAVEVKPDDYYVKHGETNSSSTR
jgi:hypothetical protein